VIILWSLLPIAGHAQKLRFEQLSIRQGLPASEVYNLFEDNRGYIWAFTEYGIAKHNGNTFVAACRNLPIEQSAVYVVRQSLKGDMYIANSQAQIYRVEHDSAFVVEGMGGVSKKIIERSEMLHDMLVDDHAGHIYFSTLCSSYMLHDNRVKLLLPAFNNDSGIICFKRIGRQFIAVRTFGRTREPGYIKILGEDGRLENRLPYKRVQNERNAIRERNNILYLLNMNKLTCVNGNTTREISFDEATITIELSPDGHIWIGTIRGLYEFDTELNLLSRYFEDCVVSDILFDRTGGMWVSTIERGIYHCKNVHSVYYNDIKELSKHVSLLKQIGQKFFIGTSQGHLFVKENGSLKQVDLGNNASCINDITYFKGQYIVGAKMDIMVLDEKFRLVSRDHPLIYINDSRAGSYGFLHKGRDTLMFVIGTAVIEKTGDDSRHKLIKAPASIRCVVSKGGVCLAGSTKGLFIVDETFYCPEYLRVLQGKPILSLLADAQENTWICTKMNGLYFLGHDNRLSRVRNVPSETVNNICFVNDTIVLLSTNKGLFENSLRGMWDNRPWRLLLDDETLAADVYGAEIYVATKHGLAAIDMENLFRHRLPAFYLASMFVNDREKAVEDAQNVQLQYWENDLRFHFDVFTYRSPGQDLLYELDGPSPGRGAFSGRELHLQNLSPGEYRLRVLLTGAIDNPDPGFIGISFVIVPAFWQTRWFYVLVVVMAFVCSFGIAWLIYQHFKRKEMLRTKLIREMAEYRLTALKAQINPHFISNSLGAVQQLILDNEIDRATQYIAKFSLLIRYVLRYSDKSLTYLNNEIKIIDINVELEQLRFDHQFEFEKLIDDDIELDDILVPTLITQPIIENAIWHGLLPLKGKRLPKLTLKIAMVEQDLVISIIDNGVGRNREVISNRPQGARESKGTWLVKNWIENLNHLTVSKGARIVFKDLYNEHNSPVGTQVDIILPLSVLNEL
jgi:ligand-binding sensor domain-containing protein